MVFSPEMYVEVGYLKEMEKNQSITQSVIPIYVEEDFIEINKIKKIKK